MKLLLNEVIKEVNRFVLSLFIRFKYSVISVFIISLSSSLIKKRKIIPNRIPPFTFLINKIMEKFGGNGFPKAAGTVIESTNIYYIVDNIISSTKQYIDLLLPEIKQHQQQNKTF